MGLNKPLHERQIDLWQRVTSSEALFAAWSKVLSNKGSAGGDGVTTGDFGRGVYANLMQLRSELLQGTYKAQPYRKVAIPKRKPGYRILTIPAIRDRVVHTSIATALTPLLEAVFENCSFAYRPNRGVVHAVERIEMWRRRGFEIVIEADIVGYFDNIDHSILMEKLEEVLGTLSAAAPIIALVTEIVSNQGDVLGTPGRGLAQGSPLSPLLANLYLDALDEALESQHVKLVRFADDFVILCKTEKRAEEALKHCASVIAAHNLTLHDEGTRIVSFDKGFDFIGYLFLKTLALKEDRSHDNKRLSKAVKLPVTNDGIIALDESGSRFDPGRRVLYVLDPSHQLTRRNRSFSVLRSDASELLAIPHRRVGRIEIGPRVDYNRAVIELALESKVEIGIVDAFGQTKGTISCGEGRRSAIHLGQANAVLDDIFRVSIARNIVSARIRNQRTQLMRLNRERKVERVEVSLKRMRNRLDQLPRANSIDKLRGQEGAAAANYWVALGALAKPEIANFKRTRPAVDPINAAINYLTGILERDIRAAIQSVGLLPGIAFLHGTRDRHDGLVFDLMEPFRAPLTEGLAIFLFSSKRLRSEMFCVSDSDGVVISQDGRRAIVQGYETAVARRINVPSGSGKLAWRPMMRWQAQRLVDAVLRHEVERFIPYLMEA